MGIYEKNWTPNYLISKYIFYLLEKKKTTKDVTSSSERLNDDKNKLNGDVNQKYE